MFGPESQAQAQAQLDEFIDKYSTPPMRSTWRSRRSVAGRRTSW